MLAPAEKTGCFEYTPRLICDLDRRESSGDFHIDLRTIAKCCLSVMNNNLHPNPRDLDVREPIRITQPHQGPHRTPCSLCVHLLGISSRGGSSR